MAQTEKQDREIEKIGRTLFAKYIRFGVAHSEETKDVTLTLEVMSRSISRTVSEVTVQDPVRVESTWAEIFMEYDKEFSMGNVPVDSNPIPGGYMKEEAMKSHAEAVLAADGALYDAGFADGKAEQSQLPVGEGKYTEEQVGAIKSEYEAKLAEADSKMKEAQAKIDEVTADDESDKAAIASRDAKLEAIKLILSPSPVVELPVPEAPVEQTV